MNIDKPLIAKLCGVGYAAFALKALVLIARYKEVVIMEPNRFILYFEIIAVTVLFILSFQGLLQTFKQKLRDPNNDKELS